MTAQFRIGGVYRNREGMLVRLCAEGALGQSGIDLSRAAYSNRIKEDGTLTKYGCGICDLATGRMNEEREAYADLVTGELSLKNGQWVPVAEEAPKTEEALLAEIAPNDSSMDVMRPALTWATPKPVDRWEGYAVKRGAVKHDEYNPPARTEHVLQRMTDPSDPLHGSAALLQAD